MLQTKFLTLFSTLVVTYDVTPSWAIAASVIMPLILLVLFAIIIYSVSKRVFAKPFYSDESKKSKSSVIWNILPAAWFGSSSASSNVSTFGTSLDHPTSLASGSCGSGSTDGNNRFSTVSSDTVNITSGESKTAPSLARMHVFSNVAIPSNSDFLSAMREWHSKVDKSLPAPLVSLENHDLEASSHNYNSAAASTRVKRAPSPTESNASVQRVLHVLKNMFRPLCGDYSNGSSSNPSLDRPTSLVSSDGSTTVNGGTGERPKRFSSASIENASSLARLHVFSNVAIPLNSRSWNEWGDLRSKTDNRELIGNDGSNHGDSHQTDEIEVIEDCRHEKEEVDDYENSNIVVIVEDCEVVHRKSTMLAYIPEELIIPEGLVADIFN